MNLFKKKVASESVVLIDVNSLSIGGALVLLTPKEPPTIFYATRMAIEARKHETAEVAMQRTIEKLTETLVTKGAPAARHELGSGHIDRIVVSVSTPWQKTAVHTEKIEQPKPFLFTHALVADATKKDLEVPEGYYKSDELLIATLLNGYEIAKPYGKKAARAELILLTSFIQKDISKIIETTLRKTYHTHALSITAFGPIAYTIFRDIFTHEKDFLVIHIGNESTDLAFVKRGLLVDVSVVEEGIRSLVHEVQGNTTKQPSSVAAMPLIDAARNSSFEAQVEVAKKTWLQKLNKAFENFSSHHALPRTIFLLADLQYRDYLLNLLDSPELRRLWLTEQPLHIIPVIPSHIAFYVRTRGDAESDVFLSLLALFANKKFSNPT